MTPLQQLQLDVKNIIEQLDNLSGEVEVNSSYINQSADIIVGITFGITVVIALFVTIQFIYARKVAKEEVKELKEEIAKDSNQKMKDQLNQEFGAIENRFSYLENKTEAETARILALASQSGSLWQKSFYWWLRAAYYYDILGSKSLRDIGLKSAEDSLDKPVFGTGATLMSDLSEIQNYINHFKTGHKLRMEVIEQKLKDYLSKPTPPATPALL